ncbi:PAS domain S-box protein [Fibrisoma montanum]|uniref:histidine kinase n=1 Tax=Fibrisoma montanum TaxID=2305895 RepID=A0A418MFC8_9BACT|nr:ATP-binding protein [Fibrisoma montanum]RIV25509.1 PAS domain S-box protein [Fibrisoma montanum]
MHEIASVTLHNEMDLILANKRSMRLAELAGLSLAAQTTFATAVSEVSRYAIERGLDACLTLYITDSNESVQSLVAQIARGRFFISNHDDEAFEYARRLVNDLLITDTAKGSQITLRCHLHNNRKISSARAEQWSKQFVSEPPVSPYDEIKRKNAQLLELSERLRESEQHYRSLTDSLPVMIFTADVDGRLTYANERLIHYTGQSIKTLNQTKWQSITHEDDFDRVRAVWAAATPAGRPFQYELRLKEATTDDYLWHMVWVTTDTATHEPQWTGIIVNIHAQKLIEQTLSDNKELKYAKQQLEKYQRELESSIRELNRSNTELSQFAYIASHDLQEPLRKIQAFGDVLLAQYSTQLDASGADVLHRMQNSANRMQHLVKDLLTFSRLTTRPQSLRPLDLNQILTDVLSDLEVTISDKQASISIEPLPTLPGDPLQLRQLFQNLLSNALKFAHTDRLPAIKVLSTMVSAGQLPTTVSLHNHRPYYALVVADNGIGLDEKYSERIFQLFQRLHNRRQYEGTGMGLAICKKVAENHGGTIAVHSQVGEGTTMTVYLPAD